MQIDADDFVKMVDATIKRVTPHLVDVVVTDARLVLADDIRTLVKEMVREEIVRQVAHHLSAATSLEITSKLLFDERV